MYTMDEESKKRKREEMERKVFGRDKNTIVPAFLTKTYEIMHNPEYEPYISWNDDNDAIRINDVIGFSKYVVPKYFKHSNFASFVRQLNMYGFHKTKQDPDWREFQHKYFKKNRYDLLRNIKRKHPIKTANVAYQSLPALSVPDLHYSKEDDSVYDQVAMLQDKYDNLEKKYDQVLQENMKLSTLLREIRNHGDQIDERFTQTRAYVNFLLQKALDTGMITRSSLMQLTSNPLQDSLLTPPDAMMMAPASYPLLKNSSSPQDNENCYMNPYELDMSQAMMMPTPQYQSDPPSPPIIEDLDVLASDDANSMMY